MTAVTTDQRPAHEIATARLLDEVPATLPEILALRAGTDRDKAALSFLDYSVERLGVERTLTFAQLDARVTDVAATLSRLAAGGERVAVLAPQGLEFVIGFLAALRAGLVAVPLFSPDLPGHADRLRAVLDDARPALALATSANAALVRDFVGDVPTVDLDDVAPGAGAGWSAPALDAADVAYLQYTSGSTRLPAGVCITHRNVVTNAAMPLATAQADADSTLVSWLPLFHDMGLVFVVGGSLVGRLTAVFMDPISFLMKPARWLRALSEHPRSFTAAPNFAYDFCAKRISDADRETLDLSGVLIMFNGAEPIIPKTLSRFYEVFGPQGLAAGCIAPSYGLAESTVYVTTNIDAERPQTQSFDLDSLSHDRAEPAVAGRPAVELAACGVELGRGIAIADPATGTRLRDGRVGEIWLRNDSVGAGYWNKPELTGEAFGQTLHDAGELPATPWLRTGDLGTIVDDRLFVTGRSKDLLIIDGRNHYPQDLEQTVEHAHEVVGHHRSAAFSVPSDEGEKAVVVAEISRHHLAGEWTPADVVRTLTLAASRDHGVALQDVVLIAPDTIPRTTSGKIARATSREAYLAGSLVAARPEPAGQA